MRYRRMGIAAVWILALGLACGRTDGAARDFHDLTPTPVMGWNSWYCFGYAVDEASVLATADALVKSGMKDVGYEYVVIDDVWQKGRLDKKTGEVLEAGRDENGELLADPEKFPNGIAPIADYIHGLGLKFGIYTGPGYVTCSGRTGSRDFERKDLETFVKWGVDFIKLDWCSCPGTYEKVLTPWREILDGLDRPIVLSVNAGRRYGFLRTVANQWRTTGDIAPVWDYPPERMRQSPSIRNVIESQAGLAHYQYGGSWNDPDILQVGMGELSEDEQRAHFSLWAMLGAPLIAGNDLRTMPESVCRILTNREVITLDQDPLGDAAGKIAELRKGEQVWFKRLRNPMRGAAALLNHTATPAEITLEFGSLGISGPVFVRDLWRHEDVGLRRDKFSATVPAHGVVLVRLDTCDRFNPTYWLPMIAAEGQVFEAEDEDTVSQGSLQKETAGFSGRGYAQSEANMHEVRVTWLIPNGQRGRYQCQIRYSLRSKGDSPSAVRINEERKNELTLKPTGQGWGEASFEAELDGRVNHICLYGDVGMDTVLLVDHLRVQPMKP
jgi:alpha-galactosidase